MPATAPPPAAPALTQRALPPSQQELWSRPAAEPAFAQFADWTRHYTTATPQAGAAMEAEGLRLARARLAAMAEEIQSNPQRALELAVPQTVRDQMPDAVKALLEQPVNAKGDLEVLAFRPVSGDQAGLAPVLRYAEINGERHQVFTYGRGLRFITKAGVPLNGIRVPADASPNPPAGNGLAPAPFLMALSESPARVLDAAEIAYMKEIRRHARQPEPVCSISGQPWTTHGEETAVQLAGNITTFCGRSHAEDWAAQGIAASGIEGGAFFVPASEGTAASSYTEGRKRMLCLRPYWTNYAGMTTNEALTHWVDFSNYMFQLSYGKLVFAPLGRGSDISTEIYLPGSVANYTAGLGSAPSTWGAVRTAAAAAPYNYVLANYDFVYYCTKGQPAASYAGLGFVGGVGFHLANGYFTSATAGHEFGHNLGLNHAHFWDTAAQTIIGTGQNVEYGDNNDPMGGGGNPNQYNARYKNYLGWIPDSDVADLDALGSGLYRLYAFDLDYSTSGLRGLKFTRNASQNYWLNFRQRKTSKKALMNGAQLLWTGSGNQGSYVLDVRLKGDADDNAIAIGRTFSDPARNFHVTPVGKGNTYPESLDMRVNIGPFPSNLPPILTVASSPANPSPGAPVSLGATASDPNGDELAYFWEFGDGDYSVDNRAVTTHSFPSIGEYAVQCTASDMKGGATRRTIIVRVGNPTTFRISGRVLDQTNRPLAGIRISTDSGKSVFTDSDGTYTLVGLPAASYTLDGAETLSGSLSFAHPFFNNPITVGPNFTTADFIGVPGSLNIYTPLVARASSWRYLDKGTDQGTAWRANTFNDSGWSNGIAPLGYPSGAPINTVIGYGANANSKYITTYFRKSFVVPNPLAYTNLLLETLRDDGVVVYLNGSPVFTNNMPAGTIAYSTLAVDAVEPDSYFQTPLSRSLLVAGTNYLAAEVHQVEVTSSDIALDVALSGLSVSNASGFTMVYVSSPPDQTTYATPTNVTVTATAVSGGAVTNIEFYLDGAKVGEDPAAPYGVVVNVPTTGAHTLRVVASIGALRSTSAPVNITVAAPASGPPPTPLALIAPGATWKYLTGGTAAPPTWASVGFNDASWPSGAAQLGYGEGDEATVLSYGGNANNKWITYYFRRAFTVADAGAVTNLSVRLKRDDGGIVYLNGVEVFRSNITNGPVNYLTLAFDATDDGAQFFSSSVDPALLQPGTNVVAVEIHQTALTSSDVSFDLGLDGLASTNRPRGVYLTAPADGATLSGHVALAADAVAGGNLGVPKTEFFAEGVKIGEDTSAPYTLVWNNASPGAHTLMAVATDSAGGSVTSAPVNVTITPPPAGTALISFGDIWNYKDQGVDLGTTWTARGYNDYSWSSGPSRLGYGGDGELTIISYGTNANSKHVTTYFRKTFTVANPAAWTGLLLQLVRDDGAVVYLNGVEKYRNNLQEGLVSWNSLATSTIDGALETTPVEVLLDTASLVAGENVLAVEIHQAAVTSSDLGFNLALTGLVDTNTANGVYLAAPANGTHYNSPANVGLSAFAAAPSPVTLVEYFDGATKVGQSSVAPFNATWNNAPVGAHTLTARATYGAGQVLTSPSVSITVGYPPPPTAPIISTLIPAGATWNYWDNATPVSLGWQGTGFDASGWPVAPARFGFGLDGEATLLTQGRVSHYFRRWFNVANPFVLSELVFQLQRDDGAVVYLNGVEIYRSNMPAGAITANTLASTTVNTPDETTFFETVVPVTAQNLVTGSNLVAVELHQASATSSDAGFNLQLMGIGTTGPRVYFTSPVDGSSFLSTATVPFNGTAYAGTGQSLAKVELFADGVKLNETNGSPFHFTWVMPGVGPHMMLARMTDGRGYTVDSSPLTIHSVRQPITTMFIPSNSVWKYLSTNISQGTAWVAPTYNDGFWPSGQARLGAEDGATTTINIGPVGARYPTIYFRKTFTVPPGAIYTNLLFKLARDDGAVVYLNGFEAYRDNMPSGVISYTTPAATSAADEQTFFPTNIAINGLPAGANLIAVEVHQINATSTDLGFNLELTGSGYLDETSRPLISIELADGLIEISWPATYTSWRVYSSPELLLPIDQWTPVTVTPVVAGGRIVVSLPATDISQFFRLGRP